MKKQFYLAFLMLFSLFLPQGVMAEKYMTESFSYDQGNLYGQGSWLQYARNSADPVQVNATQSLTFNGYQSAPVGGSVTLKDTNVGQDLFKMFKNSHEGVNSGELYTSFLINVSNASGEVYFFALVSESTTGIKDKGSTSEYGRLFAKASDNEGKFLLGASKNGATMQSNVELNLNETYLVVCKYEFVEGTANDVVTYYINPQSSDITTAEHTLTTTTGNGEPNTANGLLAVGLRQGTTTSKTGPVLMLDELRIATTYAELFDESQGGAVEPADPNAPTVTVSPTTLSFGSVYQNQVTEKTFNVKATNLTEDIVFQETTNTGEFTLTPSTIAKEDAMSADGATVTAKYLAKAAGNKQATFKATTAGVTKDIVVSMSGTAYECTEVPSSQFVNNNTDEYATYHYTGKAVVTYVQNKSVWAQDIVGGICVDLSMVSPQPTINVGDEITDIYYYYSATQSVPSMGAFNAPKVTATGKTKEPLEVTASTLLQSPESYIHRLVTVKGVDLSQNNNAQFATGAVQGVQNTTNVTILPFLNTDLAGETIPNSADVTGISRSMTIVSLSPRSKADVVSLDAAAEDGVTVEVEKLYNQSYANVGDDLPYAKYTVTTKGLQQAGEISLSGKDAAQFTVDKTTIPAGDGTTVVQVNYKPTAAGVHSSAVINFTVEPVEWNQSFPLSASAIDPNNPPTVTYDASALADFSAKVGEQQTQTLTFTTANLADYGTVRFTNATGQFLLGSSLLLKSGETQITITFAPKQEGEFTDEVEVSALGVATTTFQVKGKTTAGKDPDTTEGDAFALSNENPLALMIEGFDNVTSNKPLQVNRWNNAALKGTRAWWGYNETDADTQQTNGMAKVTGYDSFGTVEGTPCEMLLTTPPLAYEAAAEQLLTFRIKGKFLSEGQTDQLAVFYIDNTGAEVYTEALQGLNIPATSDLNDQWQDYVLDLKGLDLADPFFIGFGFSSNRGKGNSATYFVDDVTWGRSDIPFIRPGKKAVTLTAEAGTAATQSVHIEALNLSEGISLKLTGKDAAKFSTDVTELPAAGGDVVVTFQPTDEGDMEAYLEMTSAGAPAAQVALTGTATAATAIGSITLKGGAKIGLHNGEMQCQGGEILGVSSLSGSLHGTQNLAKGVYLVTVKSQDGKITTQKVVVK